MGRRSKGDPLCGAGNQRFCELRWDHEGDHEWTRGTKRFRWRNNGKAVKRYPKEEEE